MSKTDGEYELVLGNRQLLSAFFIIVILFGVFFTMGYVVGRNSAPAAAASVLPPAIAPNVQPEAAVPAAPPPVQTATHPVESSTPPVKETKEPAPMETKKVAPPKKSEAPPKADSPRERPSTHRENALSANSSGVVTVNPGAGSMYLQVAAAAQPQAGVVVDTLKQKGFPALLTHGPNPTLFRVMVGPYADAAALGKAKADLENAGFHPLVRK
jgi:cell division protein FtsN